MQWAEEIRQTGTEGMSMAQGYGNYPPYAKNRTSIKTYRTAVRHCFFPAFYLRLALFSSITRIFFFFLASCEGVLNGKICSYNGARREHAAENILGGSRLDHRIARAYFTLMLIDIHEYEASPILLLHLHKNKACLTVVASDL